jgi:hypothetical protein
MKHMSLFFFLVITISKFSFCQSSDSTINWTENLRLGWKDFNGPPDNSTTDMACTFGSMKYDFAQVSQKEFTIKLYVYFEPQKSWVKHGNENDNLLIHEQCHFDVYEIFARKLIKRLEETKSLSGKDLSDNINRLFKETFNDLNKFQDKYDVETNHSRIAEKQKEWTKKIKDMLEEYKPWAKRELKFNIAN